MLLTDLIPNFEEVIPYQYDKIQTPEFDAIINKYLATAVPSTNPQIIHMAGVPGAGKTTFYHSRPWPEHVAISFDNIMEDIPAYQQDVKQLGSVQAFSNWEIPARILGYEVLLRAVEAKKNIFFDHSGAFAAHLDLMKNIKKFGYTTEMYYISCSLDCALYRAVLREKETKRHTPPEKIKNRFLKIATHIREYQKIIDKFYQFDSSDAGFIEKSA